MNSSSDIAQVQSKVRLEEDAASEKIEGDLFQDGTYQIGVVAPVIVHQPSRQMSAPRVPGKIVEASSAAFEMYGERPPIEETEAFRQTLLTNSVVRASQISPIAVLYPAETIARKIPPRFFGGDENWRQHNLAAYKTYVAEKMPACVLSLLRDVTVQNAAIYFDNVDVCTMVYELHRPNDRPSTIGDAEIHLRERTFHPRDEARAYVFIASAGSHNWGHWLTDDLPRVAAAAFLRQHLPQTEVIILLLSFGPAIDESRRQSIECHPDLDGVSVVFLQRFVAIQFDELYFASPVSYHPTVKLRSAVDYIRRSYALASASQDRRLYVTRPVGDVRSLANAQDVESYMVQAGFEIVDCASLSFDVQVRLFSEASLVVGLMGAAMTNTIFSPPGIDVIHLACSGWTEPYYWDLADSCNQRCRYVFGPSIEPEKPAHFARFTINIDDLANALSERKVD